jgi:hypothetical protein
MLEPFLETATSRITRPSAVVLSAVERNVPLLLPRGPRVPDASENPFERMMAVHMRRGDFEGHCAWISSCTTTWFNWYVRHRNVVHVLQDLLMSSRSFRNLYPTLPDKLELPANCEKQPHEVITELVRGHCYPTEDEIATKIRDARNAYITQYPQKTLDTLFLMTDANQTWVESFGKRMRGEGWNTVIGSRDIKFWDNEQKEEGMAIDMEIGRRVEVFIGNGVSGPTIMHAFGMLDDS